MSAPHFTATANYNEVVRELQKVQAANQKLENQINQQSATSRKRARSFSSEMKSQLGSVVAGFASLQGVTQLVTGTIQHVREESLEAVSAIKGLEQGFKQFMQVTTSAWRLYSSPNRGTPDNPPESTRIAGAT